MIIIKIEEYKIRLLYKLNLTKFGLNDTIFFIAKFTVLFYRISTIDKIQFYHFSKKSLSEVFGLTKLHEIGSITNAVKKAYSRSFFKQFCATKTSNKLSVNNDHA